MSNLVKILLVITFLFCHQTVFAGRDIFNGEENKIVVQSLQLVSLREITLLGSLESNGVVTGFLQDKAGDIYLVKVGDLIGKAKIIKIYNEQIVLLENKHFMVVK